MSWEQADLEARQLGRHRTAWDALNARHFGGHPFADSRFVDALLQHFGRGTERLFVHRGYDGATDGMLLLEKRRLGIWRQFMPSQLQAGPVLLPNRHAVRSIFEALPAASMAIEFLRQDPKFCTPGLLGAAPEVRVDAHATTMEVALDGKFETYWDARSRNLTKNIRRYQRRVQTDCQSAELVVLTEPGDMAEAVRRYGLLESAGWKGAAGTAVSADNAQGRFYAQVMPQFAETDQAAVYEYWLDGALAASRLLVSGAGLEIILKTSYDERLSQCAPGRLLLHALLERSFREQRHRTVEFYTDATPDQLAWATHQRTISHVTYFRLPWLATAHDLYRRHTVPAPGP
jgi:CelD/BcsL family acetyltransferase involved in cellulose biosynthesis